MRRIRALGTLAVLLAALAGCAGTPFGPPPPPRLPAEPTDAVTCADPFLGVAEGAPQAGTVPDGFDPVAIVRCNGMATEEGEDGVWSGTAVERLEGDLRPLLDALAADSDPPSSGWCTADMVVAPDLWAADAEGRFVRLSFPMTGCHQPKADAMEAAEAVLAGLRVTERTFTREAIVESRAAAEAGCATQAGVLVLGATVPPATAETIDPEQTIVPEEFALIPEEYPTMPDPDEIDGMLVCAYIGATAASSSIPAPVGDAGQFVGAERRDAAQAREILVLAHAAAPHTDACATPATRFVVAHPTVAGQTASVGLTLELDGCGRLIGADFRALEPPPGLRDLLAR
jgi:hypothetical protein